VPLVGRVDVTADGGQRDERQRHQAGQGRARGHGDGGAGGGGAHDGAGDAGPDGLAQGGADHALEAVHGLEVRLVDERRQPRGVGRVVERHPHPGHQGHGGEVPDLRQVEQGQRRDQGHAGELERGDAQQDALLRDPVGHHAADQRRDEDTDGAGGRHERELTRTAAEPDDLPDQGHDPDARGEGGEGQGEGEPSVGSVAERPERTRHRSGVLDRAVIRLGQLLSHVHLPPDRPLGPLCK
jgi:hypothetical protein